MTKSPLWRSRTVPMTAPPCTTPYLIPLGQSHQRWCWKDTLWTQRGQRWILSEFCKTRAGSLAALLFCHTVILSLCHSVCLAHCISSCLSDWRFDILLTFWTTFVLITKLKSGSVCLSVCLSVRLSFYFSDILLTFGTTFVLITKLKS